MYYDFIKHLGNSGLRVFTVEQAIKAGQELGLSSSSVRTRLSRLAKKGFIERLKKGLYCLAPEFLTGIPIHEYEIALALANPSALAYLTAISLHKLTDQISSIIYIISLEDIRILRSSYYTYSIRGITYRIVYIKKEHFFGIEKKWVGTRQVEVTDLERTLLDGLIRPKYCGGFREVLHAYDQSIEKIDIEKIVSYATRISYAACKRLGWILTHLGVDKSHLEPLLKRVTKGFSKLDPSGSGRGPRNHTWLLVENI